MAWFTSQREQRLWIWALLVLAAIMIAGALAGSLVGFQSSETVLSLLFAGGFALAVTAVVGMAIDRAERWAFWVALGVVAALAMIPVRSGLPAVERTHLFEYGLLAVVLYEALTERRKQSHRSPPPALAAVAITTVIGWLDEALQRLMPGRVYDLRDVGTNALAALLAVSVLVVIKWGKHRRLSAGG